MSSTTFCERNCGSGGLNAMSGERIRPHRAGTLQVRGEAGLQLFAVAHHCRVPLPHRRTTPHTCSCQPPPRYRCRTCRLRMRAPPSSTGRTGKCRRGRIPKNSLGCLAAPAPGSPRTRPPLHINATLAQIDALLSYQANFSFIKRAE